MKRMKLMAIFCLSILLVFSSSCAVAAYSAPKQIQQEQPSFSSSHQQANDEMIKFSVPSLPRKLRLLEEVPTARSSMKQQKRDSTTSGKGSSYDKEQNGMMHESKAQTWPEWIEGTDTSQFFTMDYTHVRRRRPIHNKSLPAGP